MATIYKLEVFIKIIDPLYRQLVCIIARNAFSENHHNMAIFSVTDISVGDDILRILFFKIGLDIDMQFWSGKISKKKYMSFLVKLLSLSPSQGCHSPERRKNWTIAVC